MKTIRIILFGFLVPALLSGCGLFDYSLRNTVDPDSGTVTLSGLDGDVRVRRDDLGIPVIEAENMHDLLYGAGYVMASDRLAQMVSYSLLGQGRLAEMTGAVGLDIDIYIRTLDLPGIANHQYDQLTGPLKDMLSVYSEGVNAYIEEHRDRLPLDFKLLGYTPEPWEPIDSLYVFNVLSLGLAFNIREEMAFLNLAGALGTEKAAWLFPIYPDEPLPFEKAAALGELDLGQVSGTAERMARLDGKLSRFPMPLGVAASNNWAVAPERTAKEASIVANDTHLPLEHPPIWMLLQLKTPDFHAAGIAMPGIPGIVAGYNGHIAWGMTMVMGDSQDLFVEKLKQIDGWTHYLYRDKWYPVTTRKERFRVKGEKEVELTISATRHGPLLNDALSGEPKHPAFPTRIESPYGIALQTVSLRGDVSFDGMYELLFAKEMDAAREAIGKVRFMDLNFIYGDAENIAWQVTGCYPIRGKGRGHLPSPGWTGEYDWDGYLPVDRHPYEKNPSAGYLYTANHRTIDPSSDIILGNTWYAPERAERIAALLSGNNTCTWQDAVAMQNDQFDLLVPKVKQLLFKSPFGDQVRSAITALPLSDQATRAEAALEILAGFDGNMRADSPGAAMFAIFQHFFIRNLFLDELGPETSAAWKNYMILNSGIYAADQDHLLGREESPFWDNIHTPKKETKPDILAKSLAEAMTFAEKTLGGNPENWRWGELHTFSWETGTTKMAEHLSPVNRLAARMIGKYTDRGPYPAGGSLNSLNVAGFYKGQDFKAWLVPAMRMVVDFSRDEPLFLTICGGQSGNPASPHSDDGIPVWLKGDARQMAFRDENIEKQYDRVLILKAK